MQNMRPLLPAPLPAAGGVWLDRAEGQRQHQRQAVLEKETEGGMSKWVESQLMSQDGSFVYTVRDRPGEERQIRHGWTGEWMPVSQIKFSSLECFEDHHRKLYENAIPYKRRAK